MLIFLETIIVLTILFYLYKLVFKDIQNPLGIPKPLAIGILIVGFLMLPAPIKATMIIIVLIAFTIWLAFWVEHNDNESKWMWFIKKYL